MRYGCFVLIGLVHISIFELKQKNIPFSLAPLPPTPPDPVSFKRLSMAAAEGHPEDERGGGGG